MKNNKALSPFSTLYYTHKDNFHMVCLRQRTALNALQRLNELLNKVIWSNNINQHFPNWCSSEPVPRVVLWVKEEFCG